MDWDLLPGMRYVRSSMFDSHFARYKVSFKVGPDDPERATVPTLVTSFHSAVCKGVSGVRGSWNPV